jgi:protein-S-isoprenylcysteine O-methyltransferase Ste14
VDRLINFFQIGTLALFLFLFAGKSIYIKIKKKINPISLKLKKNGMKHFTEFILFILVNIWTFEVLLYNLENIKFQIFPYPFNIELFNSLFLRIMGIAMVIAGFIFYIWALKNLGNSWRLGIDENHPGKLVTTGIYSKTRNPVYVFFNLYFFGIFLINGNLIFLIFTVFIMVNLHFMILEEEKFLIKTFGKEYKNYIAATGRYFSFQIRNRPRKYIDYKY